jgi:hypothetical protein
MQKSQLAEDEGASESVAGKIEGANMAGVKLALAAFSNMTSQRPKEHHK